MITPRKSADRGRTRIEWLDSRRTFSFGDYYDPKQTGFRTLRVMPLVGGSRRIQNGNSGLFLFALSAAILLICTGAASAAMARCSSLPPASSPNFLERLTAFLNKLCYQKENWQHDAQVRTSDGVHPYVKVWYSPSLFNWMTVNDRKGPVPDGAVVVKEMYANPTAPLSEWTVMIKDASLSWDGWYWGDLVNPSRRNPNAPPKARRGGCAEPQVLLNGAGLYCLNCHASAIANQDTYSNTAYLATGPASAARGFAPDLVNEMAPFTIEDTSGLEAELAPQFIERLPSSVFINLRPLSRLKVPCMISEAYDHVVSRSAARGGPQEFVTSDQCSGCHDATGTLAGRIPNMIFQTDAGTPVNLSPYGEWRYSMMGLAGRDPVFLAQLDTESTLFMRLEGKPNGAALVQDLCLRCHGVMGQRQFHIDNPGPGRLFTRATMQDPKSEYGALARDGVSCDVCHHMAGQNLFDPSTYTGQFIVGPPGETYGPYSSVVETPMQNAIGVTPLFATQFGTNSVTRAKAAALCASCHTIELPVFDRNGRQVLDEHGQPKTEYEQTTFFEWLDSTYAPPPIAGGRACQDCHMPPQYHGTSLEFKIANIEDDTFPPVPEHGLSTRLPDDLLAMLPRSSYARHALNGINLFVLEMFDQFRKELGLFKVDPNLPGSIRDQISSQKTAVAEGVLQAQTATATIAITSVSADASMLTADLLIKNLAGHNFPTGVSFRRAFVNFQVLDAAGNVLWASGNTNADGVIVDNTGTPLVSEFFSPTQQTFQPHFWQGNPITSDKQVQIYEELALNPQGQLTTSFLSLDRKVKDNRLQPTGRPPAPAFGEFTAAVGVGDDPSYQNGCGCDTLSYQIPLAEIAGAPAAVQAALYYQSIPPYYLRQRAEEGNGPDTARLIKFASQLNVANYPEIASWKLQIAGTGIVDIK